MKFEKKPMVNWYDVGQLAATGLKTVISSVFGNFADKREIQASLSDNCPFYYTKDNEIWIDYISDLGDGFDATYTMAHLMAQEKLEVEGHTLPRGKILIMGGDEVYPTPEKIEYKNRLQGPYNAAYPWKDGDGDRPHLFALPGNHDWYDGLTNFLKLFCQGRALGNWHTQQKRSYFALQLPQKYWIWGIDVQLNADIDKPQQDYFANIVKNEMEDGDKIILCTAEPAWVYRALDKSNQSYNRLRFFIDKHIFQKYEDKGKKKFNLIATLTGDFHHYSRYLVKEEESGETSQLITAGGGGAFMHPTHMLKEKIRIKDPDYTLNADLAKTFPDKQASKKLAFRNLLFPFYSGSMVIFLGIFHLLTSWFLQSNHSAESSFMELLTVHAISFQHVPEVFEIIRKALAHNPAAVLLNTLLVFGIYAFTDIKTGMGKMNRIAGFFHAFLQFINFYFLIWLFSRINLFYLGWEVDELWQVVLFTVEMIVVGGLTSGFIFGVYLLVSTLVFESHPTEASSSYRWAGYKNFLRIHIHAAGVTIYPIGVQKVVDNWKNTGSEKEPRFEGDAIEYDLIEKPIFIKNK